MNERLRDVWARRCCFVVTLGTAVLLVGLVVMIPWFAADVSGYPLLALYAHDPVIRRTSLAAAAGLAATAFVFFRPVGWFRKSETPSDSPGNIAGA